MTSGSRPTARHSAVTAVLTLGLVLLFAVTGRAEDGAWTLSRLTAGLALKSPATVGFSEERRLQYLTEPLILEGTLSFEPPARLEKQVLRPKWERMVPTATC